MDNGIAKSYSNSSSNGSELYILHNFFEAIKNKDQKRVSEILKNNRYNALEMEDDQKMNGNYIVKSALHKAAFHNSSIIFDLLIEFLIKFSKEINVQIYLSKRCSHGNTAVHYAAFRGNVDIISRYIENGGNYLAKNNKGLTAMHMAAQADHPNVLILLKEKYNMSILEGDSLNSTPLHWGCFMASYKCVNFLLTWIQDVNLIDHIGYTPLHLAVFSERTKIIKKLIYKGADINLKDSKGRTPLDLARENKCTNVIDLLKQEDGCIDCFVKQPIDKVDKTRGYIYFFILLHLLLPGLTYYLIFPGILFNNCSNWDSGTQQCVLKCPCPGLHHFYNTRLH